MKKVAEVCALNAAKTPIENRKKNKKQKPQQQQQQQQQEALNK